VPDSGKKGRMSILIGVGDGPGRDKPKSEPSGDAAAEKKAAGDELIAAIKDGDGAAVCEAVKNVMALESYEEPEETDEAAE